MTLIAPTEELMSGPNSTPSSFGTDPALPPLDQPVPVSGVLTAEDIEQMTRDGITLGDLLRDLEAME